MLVAKGHRGARSSRFEDLKISKLLSKLAAETMSEILELDLELELIQAHMAQGHHNLKRTCL